MIAALRARLGAGVFSFQLTGEDLVAIPPAALRGLADAYDAALATVPEGLRARFELEQASICAEANEWLRRYNRSVHARVAGYLALGRRCDYAYPWPAVAILGIAQVMTGMERNHAYGLVAPMIARLGASALGSLVDGTEDVQRRTNRGIFADSVPTVLYAIRCHELRRAGDGELARALLSGPLPITFDEESRALAGALCDGLGLPEPARFHMLSALTLRHFSREQAIFSYHLGARGGGKRSRLVDRLTRLRSVPAPVIVRRGRGRTVEFRPFALPAGFDMRDHDARVEAFGRAFVTSVTLEPEDYRAAVEFVEQRFGKKR